MGLSVVQSRRNWLINMVLNLSMGAAHKPTLVFLNWSLITNMKKIKSPPKR
ncbi:Uncharacterised protein [Vibrio cholerae]|nr:Uncharacterised protein [Vibrio cholerae]